VVAARWWLMLLAVAITVVTGFDYLVRALRLRAGAARADRAMTGTG